MKKYMFAMLLALTSMFQVAHADVVVGDISNSSQVKNNCYPFGCAVGVGEYRQTYFSDEFDGAINIANMTFSLVNSPYGVPHTAVSKGYFEITMSWDNDDGSFENEGFGDHTLSHTKDVFRGPLPKLNNAGQFVIDLDKDYFFNPVEQTADGEIYHNLVMDVAWSSDIVAATNPIMLVGSTGSYTAMTSTGSKIITADYGPQTVFGTVPEPTSIALFGLGIFGLGMTRRRKQK